MTAAQFPLFGDIAPTCDRPDCDCRSAPWPVLGTDAADHAAGVGLLAGIENLVRAARRDGLAPRTFAGGTGWFVVVSSARPAIRTTSRHRYNRYEVTSRLLGRLLRGRPPCALDEFGCGPQVAGLAVEADHGPLLPPHAGLLAMVEGYQVRRLGGWAPGVRDPREAQLVSELVVGAAGVASIDDLDGFVDIARAALAEPTT